VNLSFFLSLAACRTRLSACDTRTRLCVRCVLCSPAFLSVPALGSTGSAAGTASQLLWRSVTSHSRASSATAPHLPDTDQGRPQPNSLMDGRRSRGFVVALGVAADFRRKSGSRLGGDGGPPDPHRCHCVFFITSQTATETVGKLSCQHHSISSPATSAVAAPCSVLTTICLPSRLKTPTKGSLWPSGRTS
jgi:hypothetical protein